MAMIAAADSEKTVGEIINIGSGFEISIKEIIEKVFTIIGYALPITHDEGRIRPEKSEVERLFCNNTKAKEYIGWHPEISFEEGLRITVDWFRRNSGFYDTCQYVI
jgi:nucleoside-diphosphate-sugar epimerase